ncbi:MAG: Heavy-metal-associated domain [Nitrospirae bacterium]|nr:Heavy-metal-associated domain [Nitrospirota bacterium]
MAGSAASSVRGVISVEENFNDSTLTVVFDNDAVTVDGIKAALKEAGYPVSGSPGYLKD